MPGGFDDTVAERPDIQWPMDGYVPCKSDQRDGGGQHYPGRNGGVKRREFDDL